MKHYIKLLSIGVLFFIALACKDTEKNNTNASTSNGISHDLTYTSKMTKPDKKKYYDANGNVIFEVKYKLNGFKLRTAGSQLLWKVKLDTDKIKISANEDNLNPYEIKLINSNEAKLVKDDAKLARLVYDAVSNTQTITPVNGTGSETVEGNYAPSLLIHEISEIPEIQKHILKDELVLKGF
jgi:hypothetical protein